MSASSASAVPHLNGIKATSKNAKRRAKKKEQKANPVPEPETEQQSQSLLQSQSQSEPQTGESTSTSTSTSSTSNSIQTETETEPEQIIASTDDETYKQFADVFAKFNPEFDASNAGDKADQKNDPLAHRGEILYSDDDGDLSDSSDSDPSKKQQPTISKRKQKKLERLTVAELKQMVSKPELVEYSDVNSNDPKLLIGLKSIRNSIPVPPHWSLKRDYLQNKRGIEKAEYKLPSYIADTGISTMKDALKEKEKDASLKSKTRERVQPKMGKLEIDYQKLHDAFFRFQSAPSSLTNYGDIYYEGKENEIKSFSGFKPGELSKELIEALSIPNLAPPPWLIAMQRFGPPPSYLGLKIKGLNSPIPDGAQWGYHPGGWGRPPMNEFGQPIFPEVMGIDYSSSNHQHDHQQQNGLENSNEEIVQKELWGELEDEEDEEESDEEEEEEEDRAGEEELRNGLETPLADGLETPRSDSGVHSVTSTIPGGLETPGFMELRKDVRSSSISGNRNQENNNNEDEENDGRPKELYQVIQEREQSLSGQGMMGSDRVYDLSRDARKAGVSGNGPQVLGKEERGTKRKHTSEVSLTLDPSELESLSQSEIQERYEAARKAANLAASGGTVGSSNEDLSQLREELSRRRDGKGGAEGGKKKKGGGGEKEERYRF